MDVRTLSLNFIEGKHPVPVALCCIYVTNTSLFLFGKQLFIANDSSLID